MFAVVKRFGRSESRLQNFSNEADAIRFIHEKIREDRQFKVIATYGLYEGADLIQEFTQSDVPEDSGTSDQGGGGQKRGSGQSFAPTPFNTAPRLPGVPHSWVKDDEDKKK